MAVLNIFKSLTGGNTDSADGSASAVVVTQADAQRRLEIVDDFERAGIAWLWATDADGRLIYLSVNALQTLEFPMEELLGRSLITIFETDPDSPGGKSDRPLNFQLTAHNKIKDLTVRLTIGRSKHEGRHIWWSI